jgi:hypothetical protein
MQEGGNNMSWISEHGENIVGILMAKIEAYKREGDSQYIVQIKEIMDEAKSVDSNYGTNTRINAAALIMTFDRDADPKLRYLVEGHTEAEWEDYEQKQAEEEKRKAEQSAAWQAQGLCRFCGGQLGMFKKCKACKAKN